MEPARKDDPKLPKRISSETSPTNSANGAPEFHPLAAQPSALFDALQGLARVTVPRMATSAEGVTLGAKRLAKMLLQFPGFIALQAIDTWPEQETGQFFPTEKELRDLATVLNLADVVRRERAEAAKDTGHGRYMSPFGQTARYVRRVEAMFGEPYVRSWLVGGVNAQFTDTAVFLTGAGHDRLVADTWSVAADEGVTLIADKRVSKLLADYCDKLETEGRVKPKKRKGGWE